MFWSARPCTTRPSGGFALVGDLIASGCQSPVAKLVGKGLALGFRANGDIDPSFGTAGRTGFTYDGSSGTWAVPLPDGSTVVVTDQVPAGAYGAPRALEVRELSRGRTFQAGPMPLGYLHCQPVMGDGDQLVPRRRRNGCSGRLGRHHRRRQAAGQDLPGVALEGVPWRRN